MTELGFAHITTKSWGYLGVFGFFRKKCLTKQRPPNHPIFRLLQANFNKILNIWTQWWANIKKLTQTNIRIYLDATLCTQWISEYIQMQHIYQTNIRIYLYSENNTNMNANNIWGSFFPIFEYSYSSLIEGIFLQCSLRFPLNKILHWIFLYA